MRVISSTMTRHVAPLTSCSSCRFLYNPFVAHRFLSLTSTSLFNIMADRYNSNDSDILAFDPNSQRQGQNLSQGQGKRTCPLLTRLNAPSDSVFPFQKMLILLTAETSPPQSSAAKVVALLNGKHKVHPPCLPIFLCACSNPTFPAQMTPLRVPHISTTGWAATNTKP